MLECHNWRHWGKGEVKLTVSLGKDRETNNECHVAFTCAPTRPARNLGMSVWLQSDLAQGSTLPRSLLRLTSPSWLCTNFLTFQGKSLCLRIKSRIAWLTLRYKLGNNITCKHLNRLNDYLLRRFSSKCKFCRILILRFVTLLNPDIVRISFVRNNRVRTYRIDDTRYFRHTRASMLEL